MQIWYIFLRRQFYVSIVNKAAIIRDCVIVVTYAFGLFLSIFKIMITLSYSIIIVIAIVGIIYATLIVDKYLILKMAK